MDQPKPGEWVVEVDGDAIVFGQVSRVCGFSLRVRGMAVSDVGRDGKRRVCTPGPRRFLLAEGGPVEPHEATSLSGAAKVLAFFGDSAGAVHVFFEGFGPLRGRKPRGWHPTFGRTFHVSRTGLCEAARSRPGSKLKAE